MLKNNDYCKKDSKDDVQLNMGHKRYKASMSYARAIFSYAQQFNLLQPIRKGFDDFFFMWDEMPLLRQFIQCPAIDRKRRKEHIRNIFKETIHRGILHLILRLIESDHTDLLPGIYNAFCDMVNEAHRKRRVIVVSALPMNTLQIDRLKGVMESYLEMEVTIKNEVDPDILGGYICYTDSVKIDMSIKRDLNSLKSKILSAPCGGYKSDES